MDEIIVMCIKIDAFSLPVEETLHVTQHKPILRYKIKIIFRFNDLKSNIIYI